ncbi:MAG: IPT/TIG domain-containing protein [Acidobacteriota bacterium]
MSRLEMKNRKWIPGCLAAMVALLVACSTDTPTAPTQVPSPPTPGLNAFIMSIKVAPETLPVSDTVPATVTVKATNRDTGASPANGTTVLVTTTLGEFDTLGSEAQSTAAVFDQGKAKVLLYPGDVVGTATLRADLSGSIGRTTVDILGAAVPPFVTALSPTSGPEEGGTLVTITGTNTQIKVLSPTAEIQGADCDKDGDGEFDGVIKNNETVNVVIELQDGTTSSSFDFTYTVPNPGVCS